MKEICMECKYFEQEGLGIGMFGTCKLENIPRPNFHTCDYWTGNENSEQCSEQKIKELEKRVDDLEKIVAKLTMRLF